MNCKVKIIILFVINLLVSQIVTGQKGHRIGLSDVISIAIDSTTTAFKTKNLFLSSYWDYRTYLAQNRPNLKFNSNILNYNRALAMRYNSVLDIDEYRTNENLSSSAIAELDQNIPLTGGTLSFNSAFYRLQSWGENKYVQYSTVPFKVSYSQPLFTLNELKWQRKIEPLKFEEAKKEYLKSAEIISIQATDYFFNLYIAKIGVEISRVNLANADTFYQIGQKRSEMASLPLDQFLTLKVSRIDALNYLEDSKKNLTNALYFFNSFLSTNENDSVLLILPDHLPSITISFDEVFQEAQINNPDLLKNKQQILESTRELKRARLGRSIQGSLYLSYGLNQQNKKLSNAYRDPLDQQGAQVSITIPIVDWGQRKGKYILAKRNLEATYVSIDQAIADFKENIKILVQNFNTQQVVVQRFFEAQNIARRAYEIAKQRFVLGKIDVTSLYNTQSLKDKSLNDYLNSLQVYWEYYYTLRSVTLYDFEKKTTLSETFDKLLKFE